MVFRALAAAAPRVLRGAARMRLLKLTVRVVLSLAVSAVLMWLSLRNADLRAVGRAIASIVVERIVDGLAIGLLGIVALRMLGAEAAGRYAEFARHASVLVALGFFVLCLAVTFAFFLRDRAVQLTSAILKPLSPRLSHQASSMLDAFIAALHLGSGWKSLAFFVLTAVYWGMNGLGLWLLAPAFGFRLDAL